MKARILITNDDGVHARGIYNLWNALKDFADVVVVAPSSQKSATGQAASLTKPLKIHKISMWPNSPDNIFSVNGTPADCVKLAISVVLDSHPDLIVSGINRGSNAGRNVINSGTIGGVIEGVLRGIPGIAFSCANFEKQEFDLLEPQVLDIVKHFLEHPPHGGSLYNVNFPGNDPASIKGVRMTKQGRGYWIDTPEKRMHPEGVPYYWLGGTWHNHEEEKESDVFLLTEGYTTVVPIHVDQLTDQILLKDRKENFEKVLNKVPLLNKNVVPSLNEEPS